MGLPIFKKYRNCLGCFSLCLLLLFECVENSKFDDMCKPCDKLQSLRCPSLPANCKKTRRPCGCCKECVGQFGDKCSASTARCVNGLLCVNERGEAVERVPWFMKRFQGTCQNVLVFPEVVENTDVDERRNLP